MAKQVKHRRGTTAQINATAGAQAEILVDTTKNTAVVMDGTTAGGNPLVKEARAVNASGLLRVNGGASTTLASDLTISLQNLPARTVIGNASDSTAAATTILIDDLGVGGGGGGASIEIANDRILGNVSGATADAIGLTAAQVNTMLSTVTTTSLTATLTDYVTSASLSSTLTDYVTSASLSSTLTSYATYAYIAGQSYATTGDIALKVDEDITITAGTGLSGGGDLSANRTIELAAIATGNVLANVSGSSAAPSAVSLAALTAAMPLATTSSKGLIPALPSPPSGQVLDDGLNWVTAITPAKVPTNARTEFDGSNYFTLRPTASDSYGDATAERLALQVTNHELRLFDPAATDQKVRIIALDRARHRFYAWFAGTSVSFNADVGTPTAASGGSATSNLPTSATDFTVENDAVVYLRPYTALASAQIGGYWVSTPLVSTPNAGKTTGGFLFRAIFSPRFATVHTTSRVFVGVTATDPRSANQDYGALLNHVGVCLDQGDTNLCLSFRGPSGGTRQKIDLGAYFVGNYATASTKRYAFSFYFPRNLPNKCFVTAENLTDRVSSHHVVTLTTGQDYPDPTKGLNMTAYVNNGTGYVTSPGLGLETYQLIHGV